VDQRNGGFCCACANGYFGDGVACVPVSVPRRVSGSISGTVNGFHIKDQDVHSYVVTEDGRTYTALSKIDR
jgi:nidogen (entactin)